jgi:YYY domain-containing protein
MERAIGVAARARTQLTSWPAVLAAIVLLALGLRLYGLDWDQGTHLHPDERFISLVEADTEWPGSFAEYFDTRRSPLNPNLRASYPYGTFPLFLGKAVAAATGRGGYDDAYLVGRVLTALFDVGTVLFVFAIGSLLWSRRVGLLAALLLALSVLHIQLAHFWTVDPYLTFFSAASVYFAVRVVRSGRFVDYALGGAAVGFGFASKVQALPLLFLLPVAVGLRLLLPPDEATARRGETARSLGGLLGAAAVAFAVFRVAQPYAFAGPNMWDLGLDSKFLDVLREQRQLTDGNGAFPPALQWVGRTSFVFPLENMLLWGLGLPLGLAAVAGVAYAARRLFRQGDARVVLPLALAVLVVAVYGARFALFARYFEPAYPALVLLAAAALGAGHSWGRERLRRGATRASRLAAVAASAAPPVVVVLTLAWAIAFLHVYTKPNTRIESSHWIDTHVPAGAKLVVETWDDALPLRLSPSSRSYRPISVDPYEPDSVEKVERLVRKISAADYIVLSSDRARESVPRMPATYPATARYYRALDEGTLGYRLIAKFETTPELLGLAVPDSWAEESLTVYDHPTVRIYRKTSAFTPRRALELLLRSRPERAVVLTPRQGDVNGLLMTSGEAGVQQEGGGWKGLFGTKTGIGRYLPHTLLRDHPAVAWFLALEVLSLLALPLVLVVLGPLPDRGYPLAKPLGLLFVAYPAWLGVSLGLFRFGRTAMLACAGLVAVAAAAVGWRRRSDLAAFLRCRWPYVLLVEALFAGVFLAFYALRTANPDLWHPARGGEKPMDFAYLNAVVKSSTLPPYDPWFAGGHLNYYYFGQFLTAALIKPLGIAPEVAYNLAVPMFAAFTAAATFSLAANLVGAVRRQSAREAVRRGELLAGLLAAALTVFVGNLDAARQWVIRLQDVDHWHLLSGTPLLGELLARLGGLWSWLFDGAHLAPFDWWGPTRVIERSLAITEFPFFTFLFADLHAHLMAIPFAVTATSCSLALVLAGRQRRPLSGRVALVLLAGLLIGALRATNTWDVPTQLALAAVAVIAAVSLAHRRLSWTWARAAAGHIALLVFAAAVLFAPFTAHFQQFAGGVERSPGTTPPQDYLLHFGLFVVLAAGLVGVRLPELVRGRARIAATVGAAATAMVAAMWAATAYGTAAALLAATAVLLAVAVLEVRRGSPLGLVASYALLLAALLATAGVELLRVQNDIERQNTVFKFYVQAWWLFAVVGAFSAWFVVDVVRRLMVERRMARPAAVFATAWAGASVLLVAAAMLYPISAIGPRIDDRFAPTSRTPDGSAYMLRARYEDDRGAYDLRRDYRAILWAREHIDGSPVILEGVTPLYRWGNRFSVYTGLPAVVGWDFHQTQQRLAYAGQVAERRAAVDEFYTTNDRRRALEILARYDVRYVFVGELERAYYGRETGARVGRLPGLQRVYDRSGVQIYRVKEAALEVRA